MKEAGFTTKADLEALREEIKQDNLETLAQFQASEVDPKFKKLEVGQKHIREDIKQMKWDTPSRKEFTYLKKKVDSLAKN